MLRCIASHRARQAAANSFAQRRFSVAQNWTAGAKKYDRRRKCKEGPWADIILVCCMFLLEVEVYDEMAAERLIWSDIERVPLATMQASAMETPWDSGSG